MPLTISTRCRCRIGAIVYVHQPRDRNEQGRSHAHQGIGSQARRVLPPILPLDADARAHHHEQRCFTDEAKLFHGISPLSAADGWERNAVPWITRRRCRRNRPLIITRVLRRLGTAPAGLNSGRPKGCSGPEMHNTANYPTIAATSANYGRP